MMRWLALLLVLLAAPAAAHETTRSYLTVTRTGAEVALDLRVAFRDIEVVVWMDEDLDGALTWAEVDRRLPAVTAYVQAAFALSAGGVCALRPGPASASEAGGIAWLEIALQATCPDAAAILTLHSRLFADLDPDHRLFLTARQAGGAEVAAVLGRNAPEAAIAPQDDGGAWQVAGTYFAAGVGHLMGGPDHVVFLLMLILPAVTLQAGTAAALWQVLAAITGFTLAHALSLTAATSLLLRPPTDVIAGLVAVSVILTAVDNIRPFLPGPRAAPAAFFGLIHGYGFASVLTGADLSGANFALALAAFNLGIEAAQVALVLLCVFALMALRGGRVLLWGGSLAGAAAGLWWLGLIARGALA